MATIRLPSDFREFLKLLDSKRVQYLLIGGYAVGLHGHPRPTGDIDIWIAANPENAARLVAVFDAFGFENLPPDLFLKPGQITRAGAQPLRLEILNQIDGVDFDACFERREVIEFDGLFISVISLADLLTNKRSAGRPKDLADVEALEPKLQKSRKQGPTSRKKRPRR